jgi:hypothetical protein
VNEVEALAGRLAAIANDPKTAAMVGERGRGFARETQRSIPFPHRIEQILTSAAARQRLRPSIERRASDRVEEAPAGHAAFPLTRLVAQEMAKAEGWPEKLNAESAREATDAIWAQRVLELAERRVAAGEPQARPLVLAIRIEIAIARMEDGADSSRSGDEIDPLFRLQSKRWAMKNGAIADLVPVRAPALRMIEFDYDVSKYLGAQSIAAFPKTVPASRSYILAFKRSGEERKDPLLIDELTARVLQLSDGTRTVSEIVRKFDPESDASAAADNIRWIEGLFLLGLISLRDTPLDPIDQAAGHFSGWIQNVETVPRR